MGWGRHSRHSLPMGVLRMTLLARVWGSRWFRSVGLLAVGLLLGHFAVPLLKSRDVHGIRVHPKKDGCTVEVASHRSYIWNKDAARAHDYEDLRCNESMTILPNFVVLACVCP
jgi:hypothetical protein